MYYPALQTQAGCHYFSKRAVGEAFFPTDLIHPSRPFQHPARKHDGWMKKGKQLGNIETSKKKNRTTCLFKMTWHVCTVVCSQFNSTTGFTFTVPRADTAKIAFKSGPPKTVEEVEFASNTVMLSTFSGSTECVKYCSSAICLKRAPFTSIMNGDYGSLMTLQSSCQFAFFFLFHLSMKHVFAKWFSFSFLFLAHQSLLMTV